MTQRKPARQASATTVCTLSTRQTVHNQPSKLSRCCWSWLAQRVAKQNTKSLSHPRGLSACRCLEDSLAPPGRLVGCPVMNTAVRACRYGLRCCGKVCREPASHTGSKGLQRLGMARRPEPVVSECVITFATDGLAVVESCSPRTHPAQSLAPKTREKWHAQFSAKYQGEIYVVTNLGL